MMKGKDREYNDAGGVQLYPSHVLGASRAVHPLAGRVMMPPPVPGYPEPKKPPRQMYKWTGDEP